MGLLYLLNRKGIYDSRLVCLNTNFSSSMVFGGKFYSLKDIAHIDALWVSF
jgi:hypothetical protein